MSDSRGEACLEDPMKNARDEIRAFGEYLLNERERDRRVVPYFSAFG